MNHFSKYYPLSIMAVAVIIFLSLFNPSEVGLEDIRIWDKMAHTLMYAGVASVIWFEYLLNHAILKTLPAVLATILFPILLGISMELLQEYLTKYRSGDWHDAIANTIGVVLGAVLGLLVIRPFTGRLRSRNCKDSGEDGNYSNADHR